MRRPAPDQHSWSATPEVHPAPATRSRFQGSPRLPRVYVPRPRLWEQLDRAVETSAVTLLVAPVGAGKTLGVAGWLDQTSAPTAADPIWVLADSSWTPERIDELLESAVPESTTGRTDGRPRLIVLDDAHALPSPTLRLIDSRLNQSPDLLRLLLVSRWDLPLTRLVPELLGDLTVLRGELLRMNDAECAALVEVHARTSDPEVMKAVTRHARGWCAVVVLMARAVGSSTDPLAATERLAAGNLSIADQIASEVFAALTQRQRHLLLCIANEGAGTVALAVTLSHDPEAGLLLQELEATGLLVHRVPAEDGSTDPMATRYQIHPLLGDVVRRRLMAGGADVARARATVARAVRLELARGVPEGAVGRLAAVNSLDDAAEVVFRHGVRLVLGRGTGLEVSDFASAYPETIEAHPETWFAVALDRWVCNDLEMARHWIERIVELRENDVGLSDEMGACVRLWRAALGLEPLYAAIANAKQVELQARSESVSDVTRLRVLPVLYYELAVAQNWIGDLAGAEESFSVAVRLSTSQGLPSLSVSAMSHLAFTQFMAGREHACTEVALRAFKLLQSWDERRTPFDRSRVGLATLLSDLVDVPAAHAPLEALSSTMGRQFQVADPCSRFWLRMRDAQLALMSGSVAQAEQVLAMGWDVAQLAEGQLPAHLHVALLMERTLLAALGANRHVLGQLEEELRAIGAVGEAQFVVGLRADLEGDRRSAVTAFEAAAHEAKYHQPPTRALALVCQAQLLDVLSRHEEALERLAEAATATGVRRNAMPFLGWCRQGTPIKTLLTQLDAISTSPWVHELAAAASGSDIVAAFAPLTATPRELAAALSTVVAPALSPREREVLVELGRGSTYADIAATLFVTENTVKTHVSSLYSKLAASRRSEALAVARTLHLL